MMGAVQIWGANLSESVQGWWETRAWRWRRMDIMEKKRPDLGFATFVMSLSLVRKEELAEIA
jgi:hypothetical protein